MVFSNLCSIVGNIKRLKYNKVIRFLCLPDETLLLRFGLENKVLKPYPVFLTSVANLVSK